MPTLEYKEFLRSAEWQEIRRLMIDRAGGRCEICGRPNQLDVHHKTYLRFGGQELPSDLQVVCRRCHEFIHRQKITRPKFRKPARELSDRICEAIRKDKKPCVNFAEIQPNHGKYLCHVHHPNMTYQKQRAARMLEHERKQPAKKKKKRKLAFVCKGRRFREPSETSLSTKIAPHSYRTLS